MYFAWFYMILNKRTAFHSTIGSITQIIDIKQVFFAIHLFLHFETSIFEFSTPKKRNKISGLIVSFGRVYPRDYFYYFQ